VNALEIAASLGGQNSAANAFHDDVRNRMRLAQAGEPG